MFRSNILQEGFALEDAAVFQLQLPDAVLIAGFDRDLDQELLFGLAEHGDLAARSLEDAGERLADLNLHVSVFLVEGTQVGFDVVVQLVRVILVGPLEHGDQAAFLGELQGALQHPFSEKIVLPMNRMSPMRTLGPSSMMNFRRTLLGGTSSNLRADRAQRFAVLQQQFLKSPFRCPDLGRLIHGVYRNADFSLLEVVENVGFGERFVAPYIRFRGSAAFP